MRKTDKKLENTITKALKESCESALDEFEGFQWLTHTVNFSNFPDSLRVICTFDTQANLLSFHKDNDDQVFRSIIQKNLLNVGIKLGNVNSQVSFDLEENVNLGNLH